MNEYSLSAKLSKTHRGTKRRERTRQEILDAARKVFAARGYHDTSIADITQEADIGVGTFYLHFHDKDEVFGTLIERVLACVREQVYTEIGHTELPSLSLTIRSILHHAYKERDLFRIALAGGKHLIQTFQVQVMMTQRLLPIFEQVIHHKNPTPYNPHLLAHFVAGLIINGVIWWLLNVDEPDPDTMTEQILNLLTHGIPAELM